MPRAPDGRPSLAPAAHSSQALASTALPCRFLTRRRLFLGSMPSTASRRMLSGFFANISLAVRSLRPPG